MDKTLPKPIARAPEADWEDYLNRRFVWNVDFSQYGVTLNASVIVCKHDRLLYICIEIESNPGFDFQIIATTFDENNKKLRSKTICGYNEYKGFTIEGGYLPYRKLGNIDKIVLDGFSFSEELKRSLSEE